MDRQRAHGHDAAGASDAIQWRPRPDQLLDRRIGQDATHVSVRQHPERPTITQRIVEANAQRYDPLERPSRRMRVQDARLARPRTPRRIFETLAEWQRRVLV